MERLSRAESTVIAAGLLLAAALILYLSLIHILFLPRSVEYAMMRPCYKMHWIGCDGSEGGS